MKDLFRHMARFEASEGFKESNDQDRSRFVSAMHDALADFLAEQEDVEAHAGPNPGGTRRPFLIDLCMMGVACPKVLHARLKGKILYLANFI